VKGDRNGCLTSDHPIRKRLVKIGKKDWKKDWQKIDCLRSTYEEDKEEALSKDLDIHGDV
jgi:hypothetical protein